MIALVRPECPNPAALANNDYANQVNKEALRKSTAGKCMYCEGKFEQSSYAHVEHIKPKTKFPELKFSWDNLGFSCQVCNTNKGEKYDETTPFINPYNENPEDYLVFLDFYVHPRRDSERGKYSITELQLNRAGLIERRKERIDKLYTLINVFSCIPNESFRAQLLTEIKAEADKDKEYSAMVKSVLLAQGIL
jgi:uncharacterized protein (TIGR02646 family)